MDSTGALGSKDDPLDGHPFMFEAVDVNNVGACSKACHSAMSWLLNHEASKPGFHCVVLQHTRPDGSVRLLGVHPETEEWTGLGIPLWPEAPLSRSEKLS